MTQRPNNMFDKITGCCNINALKLIELNESSYIIYVRINGLNSKTNTCGDNYIRSAANCISEYYDEVYRISNSDFIIVTNDITNIKALAAHFFNHVISASIGYSKFKGNLTDTIKAAMISMLENANKYSIYWKNK